MQPVRKKPPPMVPVALKLSLEERENFEKIAAKERRT